MNDLIVICGPTASGKTAMALDVAKELGGEIVNADSMQIYRYMDVGTAKPTTLEQQQVPHHMLDIVHPGEPFSVAKYCDMAHHVIADIHARGRVAVLTGGTGLYIDSVVNNIQFAKEQNDLPYREMLQKEANEKGNEYIYQKLERIDSESASSIQMQDTRRIIRALELYHITGKTAKQRHLESRSVPSPYKSFLFAPLVERQQLYDRIDKRVDEMMQNGLLDEVRALLQMGVTANTTAMQAIGYKELVQHLEGQLPLDEAVELVKRNSRRYAKRQLTWFRQNEAIEWIESSQQAITTYRRTKDE